MTEIWRKATDGTWSTIGTSGFANEKDLQNQIVEAPELLPLSGQPQPFLAAAFSEVGLLGGTIDVLAFEDSGRPVVIEVKLKQNDQSKRNVVAQALAYAASLYGTNAKSLESTILAKHLPEHQTLADVVEESTDESDFNRDEFYRNLDTHLGKGSFRLVIVLDDVRQELIRLTGYLDAITTTAVDVDLITVSSYMIKGDQILIPQLIDLERDTDTEPSSGATDQRSGSRGNTSRETGSERFLEIIASLDAQVAAHGRELIKWATALEDEGICRLFSVEMGDGSPALRLHLLDERNTFARFDPDADGIGAWITATVIERRAPAMLDTIRDISGVKGIKGYARATPELLDALADAYREALTTDRNTQFTETSEFFRESLADLPDERKRHLTELADWADGLKAEGLCRSASYRGKSGRFTLLMRLPNEEAGFSVIWNEPGSSSWEGVMSLNRSVIERHAPLTLPRIEAIAGRVGQGTNAEPTPELLDALADAYREAAGR